jgi:hypothetical protein
MIMSVQFLANFMVQISQWEIDDFQLVTDFTIFCVETEAS